MILRRHGEVFKRRQSAPPLRSYDFLVHFLVDPSMETIAPEDSYAARLREMRNNEERTPRHAARRNAIESGERI
jgi:hypothetical protein